MFVYVSVRVGKVYIGLCTRLFLSAVYNQLGVDNNSL